MKIRHAMQGDAERLGILLYQVQKIHSDARPDIFKTGSKKYTSDELCEIITDKNRPILVAVDEKGNIVGYVFCIFETMKNSQNLLDRKTLYIDDLCVDESHRGKHIGSALYDRVVALARENACDSITLNVWKLNESAMRFYEKCGLSALKITMEKIL